VIRVNNKDGSADILELTPENWIAHPDGDDVAATSVMLMDASRHILKAVPTSMFVDQDRKRGPSVGVGDGVFMIGRFIDLDSGSPTNKPIVRFGHLSSMPYPVEQPTLKVRPVYCCDVHSRSGFSGSPVFAFRTFGSDFEELYRTKNWDPDNAFILFLGVHCDQFPEWWEIAKADVTAAVKGMSGMTKVVPSARVYELLHLPELQTVRTAYDSLFGFSPARKGSDV
jgi:hypothetical protein